MILTSKPEDSATPPVEPPTNEVTMKAHPHIDFLKANFGLLVLLAIFTLLHFTAFHIVHHATDASWQEWIQQKEGEILAAVLTVIVGAKVGNGRATDKPSGNGAPQ
jgi:hypothetical protein